jgi:2-(1,2-epoxy-1,2-dihydrophenyl)acetyl-CoA isomerase
MTGDPTIEPELLVGKAAVTTVALNRPARANSVTPSLMLSLAATFEALQRDPEVRAVVLTGVDRFFCAGADLREMQAYLDAYGVDALADYIGNEWQPAVQKAMSAVWHSRVPVVAAINGAATAGGLDLALCCDYRISVPGARVGVTYIELGLVPVGASAYVLSRIAGLGRALQVVLSGRRMTSEQALALGLIDEIHSVPQALVAKATEVAAGLASGPANAVATVKALIHELVAGDFDAHLQRTLESNCALLREPDTRKRLLDGMARYQQSASGRSSAAKSGATTP